VQSVIEGVPCQVQSGIESVACHVQSGIECVPCQVQSGIEVTVNRFTIAFTMYIRRSRITVIIELQEIALQKALCGRQIERLECDNTERTRHGTKIVKRKVS